MFNKKEIILYFTKNHLQVIGVTQGKMAKQQLISNVTFTEQTLKDTLLLIGKNVGKEVSIIISDDVVYLTMLLFPSVEKLTSTLIGQKAQEIIPETLSETFWNFKRLTLPQKTSNVPIQVVAMAKWFYDSLFESILASKLHVKTFLPLSFAISESVQQKDLLIIGYCGNPSLLIASFDNIPFATRRLTQPISSQQVDEFLAYIEKNYAVTIKQFFLTGNAASVDDKQFLGKQYSLTKSSINPILTVASLNETWEKTHDVFYKVIQLLRTKSGKPDSKGETVTLQRQHTALSIFFTVFFIISILIICAGFIAILLSFFQIPFDIPFLYPSDKLIRPLPAK